MDLQNRTRPNGASCAPCAKARLEAAVPSGAQAGAAYPFATLNMTAQAAWEATRDTALDWDSDSATPNQRSRWCLLATSRTGECTRPFAAPAPRSCARLLQLGMPTTRSSLSFSGRRGITDLGNAAPVSSRRYGGPYNTVRPKVNRYRDRPTEGRWQLRLTDVERGRSRHVGRPTLPLERYSLGAGAAPLAQGSKRGCGEGAWVGFGLLARIRRMPRWEPAWPSATASGSSQALGR